MLSVPGRRKLQLPESVLGMLWGEGEGVDPNTGKVPRRPTQMSPANVRLE